MLKTIAHNLAKHSERRAFYINEQSFTYAELAAQVSGISQALQQKKIPAQTPVGVLASDRLETYASILALWFNRLIFVPISPANPPERNQHMTQQAGFSHLLAYETSETEGVIEAAGVNVMETKGLTNNKPVSVATDSQPDDLLYILFTSGSTGAPKGVPISRKNLEAYVSAFFSIGYDLNHEDRFLQIFDFTFDVSVQSYVLPLYLGASIYTVPQKGVRFLAALKIFQDHRITFAKLVPSTLQFYKPYFSRIQLPYLKYSLFSGEALPENITREWAECVPNAIIENHYGPTEGTIDCLYYRWSADKEVAYNGIVSIGQGFRGMELLVVRESGDLAEPGEKGELWISGDQVTPGYWRNEEKNKAAFAEWQGQRFYKTGDIVFQNEEGYYLFCGRKDNQVQIQGYRVELGEVEHHVNRLLGDKVVVETYEERGVLSLALFIEGKSDGEEGAVLQKLQKHLPVYMLPGKIVYVEQLPRTVSGKTNRKALREYL